ncbi:site-specific integrase [Streptacidiphilus sp. ASG 303]|uniref:tyrosine-type recombinase/integrase n=1 Tax=Streptacidiphilus sp. ASG 303 TaxID=2896847 RepID=UPI001E582FAA|nr:site-specific integrase [Streptacidiphilus sp. ASG 303]MCD0485352.1 site-specific integrase [Streptacidiphilus sp. ASG 303]
MANSKGRRRRFGAVRRLPSGRWQARYPGPDGVLRPADQTFASKTDAEVWLTQTEADMTRGDWRDPDAGAVNFTAYAEAWIAERDLRPTTEELYRRLLRIHLVPTFGAWNLDEISAPRVRAWRAGLLEEGKRVTAAKAYRLLSSILATAADDELIRRNPCRIRGGGKESSPERGTATIEQVYELAELVGPRWRALVLLAAFTTLRPEELAELRRPDVDLDAGTVRVRMAAPELTTGRRVVGDPKSDAGRRTVTIPAVVLPDIRRHLEWFAEREPGGLLFVGEKGGAFRRSTFGRIWRRARDKAGLPGFRFYDLRHTGNTLAAATGASLKELMARMGHASVRAALVYQHATAERDRRIAEGIDAAVVEIRGRGRQRGDGPSGTELARDA